MSAATRITAAGIWTDQVELAVEEMVQGMATHVALSPRQHTEGVMLTVAAARRPEGQEKAVMVCLDKGQALELAAAVMDALEESEQLLRAQGIVNAG